LQRAADDFVIIATGIQIVMIVKAELLHIFDRIQRNVLCGDGQIFLGVDLSRSQLDVVVRAQGQVSSGLYLAEKIGLGADPAACA
jgi:hypothetical protein